MIYRACHNYGMEIIDWILLVAGIIILYHLANGAIFVPTDQKSVQTIVRLINIQPGMKVAELGSGDGRIVIALAGAGASAVGFETNPILFFWSYWQIKRLGLATTRIRLVSFWGIDLSDFDAVVVFGMTHIMQRLQTKLATELRPGALVISNIFKFPGWTPIHEEGGIRVYRR